MKQRAGTVRTTLRERALKLHAIAPLFASLLGCACLPAHSVQTRVLRNSFDSISIPDAETFAGASDSYTNRSFFTGLAADLTGYGLSTPSLATGIFITGSPLVSVQNIVYGATTVTYEAVLTADVPSLDPNAYVDYGYDAAIGSSAAASRIVSTVVGGFNALVFSGALSGGVVSPGPFNATIALAGDWSSPARHSLDGIASGWTVTQNFIYDSATDTTFLVASSNPYSGPANLGFTLFGSPVPELPGAFLWLLGLPWLAAALKHRR
jgi:hypothetical protein